MQRSAATTGASETARGLDRGIALYIHIPFCQTKCPYCDFNTYAGMHRLIPGYLEALAREIRTWGDLLGGPALNTVFLGGGTPSLLEPRQLESLLDAVRASFSLSKDAEVSAEVNPDDATVERIAAFRGAGVNRVSMGVQSLDDGLLKLLGRRHSAADAVEAFLRLRRAGLADVNLDLMYGLPYQSVEQWDETVREVIDLGPDHVSAYCLTLEEGTPLATQVSRGRVPEPDADLAAEMYQRADRALSASGYPWYELSNWARPGHESQHNLTYWRSLPYLGVGPGAHSFLGGYRFANLNLPAEYVRRIAAWAPADEGLAGVLEAKSGAVEEVEVVDQPLEMADTMIMGLRLRDGLSVEGFRDRFGRDVGEVYGRQIAELESLGLLEAAGGPDGRTLRITERARLLANEVFWRFLAA